MAGGSRQNAKTAAALALASGLTQTEAAKKVGIGERTLRRWLKQDDFRQSVAAAKREMVSRAVAMLADASTEAATTLRQLLQADSESVRLNAAKAIIELGIKLRESEELAERVKQIEETIATIGGGA